MICVALEVEVAGAAVAVSFRGRAPRYFGKSSREEILGAANALAPKCAPRSSTGTASTTAAKSAALLAAVRGSGGSRKLGSIDRMGNKRLRCMLVEAVWRLHQWNQGWRGFQKFHHVLGPGVKTGAAAKKKAIVACARLSLVTKIETDGYLRFP